MTGKNNVPVMPEVGAVGGYVCVCSALDPYTGPLRYKYCRYSYNGWLNLKTPTPEAIFNCNPQRYL